METKYLVYFEFIINVLANFSALFECLFYLALNRHWVDDAYPPILQYYHQSGLKIML